MTNKIKKNFTDFSHKSGKLAIQIKDDYYINWKKNAQIGKIFVIFPKICVGKAVDKLPNAEWR